MQIERANRQDEIRLMPPPWTLRGDGFILFYRLPGLFLETYGFIPPAVADQFRGGLSAVMLVDYQDCPIGPYQELLFIPGQFMAPGWPLPSLYSTITKIFVSTLDSVTNGQINWGIPKERCDFRWERQGAEASVMADGVASFRFRTQGPEIPFHTSLVPAFLRTLRQDWAGQRFFSTPEASGYVTPIEVLGCQMNLNKFPDLTSYKPVFAVQARNFTLQFPEARIEDLA
jgi:hypothetical protein